MPKTKKQAKKSNRLLNWLKPSSPAKGMLLFALVFAVIGGGYMVYKSFAATSVSGSPVPIAYRCYAPHPTVRQGAANDIDCVKYAQWVLVNYASQFIAVDGQFGPRTQEAVKNLQRLRGINPVNGVVDSQTWEAIDSLIMPGNEGSHKGVYQTACKDMYIVNVKTGARTGAIKRNSPNEYRVVATFKNTGSYSWAGASMLPVLRGINHEKYTVRINGTTPYISSGQSYTGLAWISNVNAPAGLYVVEANINNNAGSGGYSVDFGADCRTPVFIVN